MVAGSSPARATIFVNRPVAQMGEHLVLLSLFTHSLFQQTYTSRKLAVVKIENSRAITGEVEKNDEY